MVTIVDFEPSPLGGAFVAGEFQDDAMLGDLLLESQCYEYRSGLCYTNTAPFVAKVDSNGVWGVGNFNHKFRWRHCKIDFS